MPYGQPKSNNTVSQIISYISYLNLNCKNSDKGIKMKNKVFWAKKNWSGINK